MTQHQAHGSDRGAAYRGVILGAIVLGILLVTIVRLTNAHYAGSEGAKAAMSAPQAATTALDA